MPATGVPRDFWWGVTTSSTQIEGAAPRADWASWEAQRLVPASGDGNGWRTNAPDDAALLASLGLTHVRVTVEWARLEPRAGEIDGDELEATRQRLQVLRDHGLAPVLTLVDTSLPGWFSEDEGGFRDERARNYFWPRHIDRMGEWFEDLAAGWVPIDDPIGWALRGHLLGSRPPGKRAPEQARAAIVGALEGNQRAWEMLRGSAPVMCVLGLPTIHRANDEPTVEARDAATEEARNWDRFLWTVPIMALRDGVIELPGGGVLERPDMAGSFDLVGLSHHYPVGIDELGALVAWPADARRSDDGYAPIVEELGHALRRLHGLLPRKPLLVASHGVATADDDWRDEILRDAISQVRSAIADDLPLVGYFHDTGIDGYEWTLGFNTQRGLIGRNRTVKPSGETLRDLLAG